MMDNKCAETPENGRKRHNITLAQDVQKKGEEMARADLRSFSNFLEWLLEQEWQRRVKNGKAREDHQLNLLHDQ